MPIFSKNCNKIVNVFAPFVDGRTLVGGWFSRLQNVVLYDDHTPDDWHVMTDEPPVIP